MAQTVIKRITVKLQADAKQFRKQMDGAVKTVRNAGARMRAAGSTISMGVTLPLAAAGGAALKFAADAEEMESKLGTVFGAASSDVRAWSKTYASSVNRGVTETRKMVSDAGDLFAGLGLTKDATLEMSKAMVTLTNDLSSFKNVEAGQAFDALRGAAVGENESLKTLGVVLDAAMVKERALAVARAEGTETLTTAHKATAAFALIQEKAANAVGDAARTSGSFTNKLRGVQGRAKDAAVKIGTMLLPAATELLGIVERLIARVDRLNPQIVKWGLLLAAVAAVIGPLVVLAGVFLGSLGALSAGVIAVGAAFGALATAAAAVSLKAVALVGVFGLVAMKVWHTRDDILEAFSGLPARLASIAKVVGQILLIPFRVPYNAVVELVELAASAFGTIGRAIRVLASGSLDQLREFSWGDEWERQRNQARAATERFERPLVKMANTALETFAALPGHVASNVVESAALIEGGVRGKVNELKTWLESLVFKVPGFAPDDSGASGGGGSGGAGDSDSGSGGGFLERIREQANDVKSATDIAASGVNGIGDALTNAITEGKNFGKAMKALFADLVKQITQAILKQTLLNSLFGGDGKGGLFGGVFSMGGKAAGGPVSAGVSYVTGERGLEVFTPDRAGHITSASKLAAALSNSGGGGGTTVNVEVNNNASGATARVDESDPNRLRVIVEDIAAESIARRGKVYSALRSSTGMRSQPMGR